MDWLWILILVIAGFALLVLLTAYICYRMAFYSAPRKPLKEDEIQMLEGDIYEAFRDRITNWTRQIRAMPHEDVSIISFDGLTLRGKFYEYAPGAPIELMIHGYRGTAERDMCGGVERCFKLRRSALLVDQRASGTSDGNLITFGVNERKDCLRWVDFLIDKFGPDVRIILTGISMGAATVMMAAGEKLPPNVVGVLADCGYSSQKEIICKVIRQLKLPAKPLYPFVKLGAKLYGHFDLEETTPLDAMKRCKVPVFFVHGENDDYVPCQMSLDCYNVCVSQKAIFTVPGAGHGLAYPSDLEGYYAAVREFFDKL
ncbi:MAG: alpha/beta hydrolase [Clostridia bacterium]|nr:alpha/beta hydrolase [Clostridia bacterium]